LNTGPSPATGVILTDVLPANFTLKSITFSPGVSFPSINGAALGFDIGDLPGGNSAIITVEGTADSAGFITNSATVSRTDSDANPANNAATAVTRVILPSFSIDDVMLSDGKSGTTNAVFNVSVAPPAVQTTSVNFTTSDLSAVAGIHYVST